MKKRLLTLALCGIMVVMSLCACSTKEEKKDDTKASETTKKETVKVTLNEVAHSIFYAPMYVAIEEGYFEDEGIDLTLVTGFGAISLVQNNIFI